MDGHQLYIDLVKSVPLGLMTWHLENIQDASTFKLIAVNPVARQILGLPMDLAEADCEEPFPAFLKIESPETYADIIRLATSRDLGEIRYRNQQAIERVVLVKAFPMPHQQMGVIFEDITDRKQAEEAIRHLERRLLFHLKQTPLAVIEWDLDFNIVEWNPAAEKMFYYSRREVLGHHVDQLIVPTEVRDEIQQIWQNLSVLKTSISSINRNITADGRMITCEWHSTPLVDEDSNVIGVLSIAHDITDREQATAELQQFAERLAQSNRELQDFASVASHDLQEPLRKIQAFANRLQTQYANVLPIEGQDYLGRMQSAADRMQRLINDLLMFSRVTTQANPFKLVNLNHIIQGVLCDLEIHIQQTGGQINVAELPKIEADPLQMRQLLQNLLSNALKFHKPDSLPIVQVQAQLIPANAHLARTLNPSSCSASEQPRTDMPQCANQWFCEIRVSDNGIGFDEKYLDRIFTVFQRLHSHSEYAGTGMGLAICRKIVERHGGTINARSCQGQGSTFIVTLPVRQTHPQFPPNGVVIAK